MNAVVGLAPRLARAAGRDGRVTTSLTVVAFAVTTAVATSVLAAALALARRAQHPVTGFDEWLGGASALLAWVATVLLVVPLLTVGGAAARLGALRRNERLATLRLLGATPREVVALTLVETATQGLVGAALGTVLYGALLPVWTSIPFLGRPFTARELWVGPAALALVWVAVPLLAAVSGVVMLRGVVVSPLGVTRRELALAHPAGGHRVLAPVAASGPDRDGRAPRPTHRVGCVTNAVPAGPRRGPSRSRPAPS